MTSTIAEHKKTFESLLANERPKLLRFCIHLTHSSQAAEDLTQEALLTAWRQREKATDLNGISYWLTAIARNVCRNWKRRQARESKHSLQFEHHDGDEEAKWELADEVDLDVELERDELITLLDRAMDLLPPETRGLLIQHYVEELPQAELAAQMGLKTSTVGVRLHRGKLALRKALFSDFRDDAVAYGLVNPSEVTWTETRIWCVRCGQHRLQGQFHHAKNFLHLRCPKCYRSSGKDESITRSFSTGLEGVKAFKPAYSRILKWSYHYHFENGNPRSVTCYLCGRTNPLRFGIAPWEQQQLNSVYDWCDRCNHGNESNSWHSRALSLPQVRQFWRNHPRMAEIPERYVEVANAPSILVGYESRTDRSKIEIAFSQNTFENIFVNVI
ncbi:MAG: RNA polymerase sigma factor [Chloroflexota bacterium]